MKSSERRKNYEKKRNIFFNLLFRIKLQHLFFFLHLLNVENEKNIINKWWKNDSVFFFLHSFTISKLENLWKIKEKRTYACNFTIKKCTIFVFHFSNSFSEIQHFSFRSLTRSLSCAPTSFFNSLKI